MRERKLILSSLVVALLLLASPSHRLLSTPANDRVIYTPFEEARKVLEAMSELPAELRSVDSAGWMKWAARRDSEIRARVVQGDEDSLVNFLLFGTSFTRRPRITSRSITQLAGKHWQSTADSPEAAAFKTAVGGRADDLVRALSAAAGNERLLFARELARTKGYEVRTPGGRARVKQYLLANLARVLNEQAGYARTLDSARLLNDPSAEFIERSKLYSARGLSSDTSLLPNFAIEKSLASIQARGLLTRGSVRRVAVVGPGLDFTDKQDGYDFYPQQTIQPFAIIDTLVRLGLAAKSDLRVTTFDLSPRVNDHLQRAIARAKRGISYTIQLPRDSRSQWKSDAVAYWSKFGDQIGALVPPVAVPMDTGDLSVRAVKVPPQIVSLINALDLNIVLQQIPLEATDAFDLIIATNIFVYYDQLEQSLALTNVARMLRNGGLLLSNNALLELPGSVMKSVDYETVVYSERPNDGDHIVWYQRTPPR